MALVLAACGSAPPSSPALSTSGAVATAQPTAGAPGMLHLTMDPPYDCCDLELRYILADGSRVKGELIRGDIDVIVNRPFAPGTLQVLYNDVTCEGSVEIEAGMESDVVMDMGFDPKCRLRTTETHPAGSIKHPDLPPTAHVGADLPFGVPSVFVLQSLDNPNAPPTARIAVDKAPWEVGRIEITPGLYELSVLVHGAVLGSFREDLVRGSDWVFPLRLLPRDVPRDCGDTPVAICERAINAGYAWGLFLRGAQYATAATIRPSQYMSCMPGVEAPLYDVAFKIGNPKGDADVTVGRLPSGRFTACTY